MGVFFAVVVGICLIICLVGCEGISKPYVMKMDRVDQKLDEGNKGYLKGTPPPPKSRGDLKRPFIAVDIDLVDTNKEEIK